MKQVVGVHAYGGSDNTRNEIEENGVSDNFVKGRRLKDARQRVRGVAAVAHCESCLVRPLTLRMLPWHALKPFKLSQFF